MKLISYRQYVLFVLVPLHAGDQPQQEIHHGGGAQVCEEELRELGLTLDVLYHLETRVLIAVPVLTTNTTLTRDTHTGLHTRCYLLWPPRY